MKFWVNRRMLKVVLAFFVIAVFLGAAALLTGFLEESRLSRRNAAESLQVPVQVPIQTGEDGEAMPDDEGALYVPRDDVETVLLLGLDRSGQEDIATAGKYAQSDMILLLKFDQTGKTCKIIHLNRDMMAEIQDFDEYGQPNGTYVAQLTLAYAHAQAYTGNDRTAGMAAVDAVSRLLYGIKIDHYVTLTMDGLMALNDFVGGVDVEILDDFSAVDETLVQGETVTLLGRHALNFVRSRWYVGNHTNLERMERHKQYLAALQKKLSGQAKRDDNLVPELLLEVNGYMTSDCTAEQLAQLAEKLRTYRMEESVTVEGEAVEGGQYMEFYPDEDALRRLVVQEFYGRTSK